MEQRYLLLKDVGQVLGLKAHQITYALATGQVPEPALRVANKRVFSTEDVERLARHFKVKPKWPPESCATQVECEVVRHDGLVLTPPYSVECNGESGHEVRDGDGTVFCWATDRAKALVIAGLLESAVRG